MCFLFSEILFKKKIKYRKREMKEKIQAVRDCLCTHNRHTPHCSSTTTKSKKQQHAKRKKFLHITSLEKRRERARIISFLSFFLLVFVLSHFVGLAFVLARVSVCILSLDLFTSSSFFGYLVCARLIIVKLALYEADCVFCFSKTVLFSLDIYFFCTKKSIFLFCFFHALRFAFNS